MTSPVRALRPAAGHLDTARGCRTAPLPRLAYSEPVRRDRCRRTRAGRLRGHVRPPTRNLCEIDTETGEVLPVVTIVTDNGGPFRSFRLEAFILKHPELSHVRTRVKSPGQNGSRERGLGTLKYERLYLDEMDDAVMLAKHAEECRIEYNGIRPHEALSWNWPKEVHLGLASPTVPTSQTTENLPTPP